MFLLALVLGCARLSAEPCACPMPGHGVLDEEDRCLCLPHGPSEPEPEPATTVEVDPDHPPDWAEIDRALADGHVLVRFARTTWPERITVERSDASEHRLILDGGGGGSRAVVPGILTGYEDARVDRTTVRGFELTGSRDKGIFWNTGDDVILDDLVVHDNKGTPAINLNYSNRSGHPSTGFTVRNSHVYNQPGECIYIGGSEGEDQPSHARVVIERNLVHDCMHPASSKHDGINVKDRIGEVLVRENVVFHTDWGIEVASPGLYANNLVFRTVREGFQVSDYFGPLTDMRFEDNAVIEAGHDGYHVAAEHHGIEAVSIARTTVIASGEAAVLVAGELPVDVALDDVVAIDNAVGFDGWGEGSATIGACATSGNAVDDDRNLDGLASDCGRAPAPGDWSRPAGPDGVFFTDDDPWLIQGVGAQLPPAR